MSNEIKDSINQVREYAKSFRQRVATAPDSEIAAYLATLAGSMEQAEPKPAVFARPVEPVKAQTNVIEAPSAKPVRSALVATKTIRCRTREGGLKNAVHQVLGQETMNAATVEKRLKAKGFSFKNYKSLLGAIHTTLIQNKDLFVKVRRGVYRAARPVISSATMDPNPSRTVSRQRVDPSFQPSEAQVAGVLNQVLAAGEKGTRADVIAAKLNFPRVEVAATCRSLQEIGMITRRGRGEGVSTPRWYPSPKLNSTNPALKEKTS